MTKSFHKCGDECAVHNEIVADAARNHEITQKKAKKKVKKIKPEVVNVYTSKPKVSDRYSKSVDEIKEIIDVVRNEDSFVALQHCIKILEGIKRDHGI